MRALRADDRGTVLAALMLTTSLVALDSTIVATAVPAVVDDLGGFSQFPWLFSVYLLAQAVSVPLYGRFADVLGRKPVLLTGTGVFVVGSLLCGLAWDMPSLIAARAVQGLGAGAVIPIAATVVGDLYSLEERSRIQGYMASVWGVSSVVGPALGGIFADYATWRLAFLINLPLGAAAMWMLARRFTERVERHPHQMDWAGALTLCGGSGLLVLALLEGGVAWAWGSAQSVGLLVTAVGLLVVFVVVESRAPEPLLPLWVFRDRVLLGGTLASLAVGALMMGLATYVPTYAQGVVGTGAVEAGAALAAMTLGWPIAASRSGRLYLRIGFRDTALIGSAVVLAGTSLFVSLAPTSPLWRVALASFVVGVGLGLSSTPLLIAAQSVVGWDRRGVVTATNLFSRSMGSAIGVAVLGAVANATLADGLREAPGDLAGRLPDDLDAADPVVSGGDPAVAAYLRDALFDAAHLVFWVLVAVAVLQALSHLLVPRRVVPVGHPADVGSAAAVD